MRSGETSVRQRTAASWQSGLPANAASTRAAPRASAIAPPSCCRRGVLIAAQSLRTHDVLKASTGSRRGNPSRGELINICAILPTVKSFLTP
jgi:hypothetical protein